LGGCSERDAVGVRALAALSDHTQPYWLSLPGSTGQSSTHGRCLLDRPVEPGDDGEVCVDVNEQLALSTFSLVKRDKSDR
jgi:hypothetical protein